MRVSDELLRSAFIHCSILAMGTPIVLAVAGKQRHCGLYGCVVAFIVVEIPMHFKLCEANLCEPLLLNQFFPTSSLP